MLLKYCKNRSAKQSKTSSFYMYCENFVFLVIINHDYCEYINIQYTTKNITVRAVKEAPALLETRTNDGRSLTPLHLAIVLHKVAIRCLLCCMLALSLFT